MLKKIGSTSPILDTTQIHKPANINNSHNQLNQSILIIPIYSTINPKINSTLTITIHKLINNYIQNNKKYDKK